MTALSLSIPTTLSERRASDRVEMAAQLRDLAEQFRISSAIIVDPVYSRCTRLYFESDRGLAVRVTLDGTTRHPNSWVLSWHFSRTANDTRLSPDFAVRGRASINPFHRQKATSVIDDFDHLLMVLTGAFACIADGSAYEEKP